MLLQPCKLAWLPNTTPARIAGLIADQRLTCLLGPTALPGQTQYFLV